MSFLYQVNFLHYSCIIELNTKTIKKCMKLFGVMSMNPVVNYVLVGFACSDNRSKRMTVVLEGICIRIHSFAKIKDPAYARPL